MPEFRTATEVFERRLFPEAIVMGMPSDEFWHGDPRRFLSYVEAYKTRLTREEEMKSRMVDYQSWLTGLYVYNAVGVVMQNAFSKGKKSKYLKEPISFTHTREEVEKRRQDEDEQLRSVFEGFRRLTDTMNNGLKKR
jgi:hypothetical protein